MRAAWLLLAASLALGCGTKVTPAPTPAPDARVQVVRFDPKALDRLGVRVAEAGGATDGVRLSLPGTLDYDLDRYAEVSSLVEGRVTSIDVRVGDRVKKGRSLVTLQVPTIAAAQAEYLGAQAAARVARQNVDRESSLLDRQLTTAREAELAKGEALRADAMLGAAGARLKVLGSAPPSSDAAIRPSGTLVLAAPIDGVVVRRDAVAGRFLTPGDTAAVIADLRTLWATVDVFEADLPYFREGTAVELTVDALPGRTIAGKVATLEPHVGRASRALRARIVVDNADGALRPGLFLRAAVPIAHESVAGRLAVPAGAVQPLGEHDVVFVEREPGTFEVRKVGVTRRTSQVVELGEGLSVGERVAVAGAFLLRGEATRQ